MWLDIGHDMPNAALSRDDLPFLRPFPTCWNRDIPGTRFVLWAEPTWDRDVFGQQVLWIDDGEVFWQIVFYQVLTGFGPAVCRECGRLLGELTPQGRPKKKTKFCKRCIQRHWRNNQDPDDLRKRWKQEYKVRKKREARKRKEQQP
jgi:hypothetical protein